MLAVVPVTRDPSSLLSAVSSIYRVWEELGVEGFLLLATGDAPERSVRVAREEAARLSGSKPVVEVVDAGVEGLGGAGADRLVGELAGLYARHCGDGLVAVISPAGRRLAAAMALAAGEAVRRGCGASVAHLHFYFGPWSGLPYPYTPRRLEPLVVMAGSPPAGGRGGEAPGRARRLFESSCRLPWGQELPPLRCAVAEAARILNDSPGSRMMLPGAPGPCGRLRVEAEGRSIGSADLCDHRQVSRLAGSLASLLLGASEGAYGAERQGREAIRSALAWTGLAHLEARGPGGGGEPFHLVASSGRPVIVDTSLVYYGAHRYAWEGGRILVPECAVVEVHSAWAEAAKRGRLGSWRDAASALAYLGLMDLLGAGASIVPAPAGGCDVSIPKADPVILDGAYMATADDGAYRYWESHPASRLARPLKVSFDPHASTRQDVDPRRDPQGLSRLYYALAQALVAAALLGHEGLIDGFTLELQDPGGGVRQVRLPVQSLKNRILPQS